MDQKPNDFFIGVINFFAVLLPGAVLVLFAIEPARGYLSSHSYLLGSTREMFKGEVPRWIAFLVASYTLGHFVFMLGSPLDALYDLTRRLLKWLGKQAGETDSQSSKDQSEPTKKRGVKAYCPSWIRKILRGGWSAARSFALAISDKWIKNEVLFQCAREIQLNPEKPVDTEAQKKGLEAITTYQWAKIALHLSHPSAIEDIHRLEAEQKFFRSLIVVLTVIGALTIVIHNKPVGEIVPHATAIALCFWRYLHQRIKCTSLVYSYATVMKWRPPRISEDKKEST